MLILCQDSQFFRFYLEPGEKSVSMFFPLLQNIFLRSNITVRKFVKLLFEVMFYKTVIQMNFWIVGYTPVTLSSLVETFLPVTAIVQNFTGTYLVFFLCIPFLKILTRNLAEKQHVYLILLFCFIYVFFGTVKVLQVIMNYVCSVIDLLRIKFIEHPFLD